MATVLNCDYKTIIEDGGVFGLDKYLGIPTIDIDIEKPTCYVDWLLEPEIRSWGIKSICVYATKITASIEWEVNVGDLSVEDKNILIAANGKIYGNETISGIIEVDSRKECNGKKWTIESDFVMEEDGLCRPQDVEINFENMMIIVS